MDDPLFSPPINKALHLRYWQRCLRTLLPHHYTPTDSQRMTLGFFIITAIDLLSPSSTSTSASPPEQASQPNNNKPTANLLNPTERRNLRQWVLSCQHPQGGFCGSPTHVLPRQHQHSANANIAATYFALLLLAMLAEDEDAESAFAGIDRVKTLQWLRRLQRPEDGSFGEVVYELPQPAGGKGLGADKANGKVVVVGGGKDMRYCYLAATIRWMLRGGDDDIVPGGEGYVEDIDIDALVAHIRRSQTYDGGFSESFRHESHAGYGYCAVAALALLDRPLETPGVEAGQEAEAEQTPYYKRSQALQNGISDIPGFISFLVSRQFTYLEPSEDEEEDDDEEDDETANFQQANLALAADDPPRHIGFNGRCNKVADTCYTWWVLGSLSILGVLNSGSDRNNTVDPAALKAQRDFLLDKTQHVIGGFGKRPGNPPDIYHSSLGLAALATLGDPGLKRFDPGLCVSADTVRKIEKGRRGLTRRSNNREKAVADSSGGNGSRVAFGKGLLDMAVSMRGDERPEWLVG
ncbi:geranylgeranyl transferase type-1 subunit beta [Cytospora paraplurivora]|uniref:Geranylgeranyl transferase type-1 subunit beta n=1 Tax=Cytospora paraplurivora TaxID=2898453 RepID=A0AAN9TYV2_9PEZI